MTYTIKQIRTCFQEYCPDCGKDVYTEEVKVIDARTRFSYPECYSARQCQECKLVLIGEYANRK